MHDKKGYVKFTKQMKSDYVILAPDMLPMHFKLILRVLQNEGYNIELLENNDSSIPETGLRYVHNDTCYPAILVIGQFLEAIKSGKYDPNKTALIMFQTGGGCRASNYISLIRKALAKAGYENIPVISFSLMGLEKHPGWKLSLPLLRKLLYAVFYADLIKLLMNQCIPYEITPGDSVKKSDELMKYLTNGIADRSLISYREIKKNFIYIIKEFASVPLKREKKIKVGIVGEIFVKYSPLANNNLEDFLLREGAEVVLPGFVDFCIYSVYNGIVDNELYGINGFLKPAQKFAFDFLVNKQKDVISLIKEHSDFDPPTPFDQVISLCDGVIGKGVKMGEGWLLTAEMLELNEQNVKNIVCTQPFGCLPNHICGKGMMKPLKESHPDINIVAIDYDASASKVNQENRIKLMLSNARQASGIKAITETDNEKIKNREEALSFG